MVYFDLMLCKEFYFKLWYPLCSAEQNRLGNFARGPYNNHLCEIIFEFGPVVQKNMPFKDISYLQLWQPASLAEQNYSSNYGRRY